MLTIDQISDVANKAHDSVTIGTNTVLNLAGNTIMSLKFLGFSSSGSFTSVANGIFIRRQ